MSGPVLRFVYAVDGDVLSTVKDYLHKLVRPTTYPCRLCSLTHGALGENPEWKCFVRQLPIATEFLHRDELRGAERQAGRRLPVVLLDGELLVASDEIDACASTDALIALVQRRLEAALGARRAS